MTLQEKFEKLLILEEGTYIKYKDGGGYLKRISENSKFRYHIICVDPFLGIMEWSEDSRTYYVEKNDEYYFGTLEPDKPIGDFKYDLEHITFLDEIPEKKPRDPYESKLCYW